MESLAGKLVLIVGLGRFGGGIGVTKYLLNQGARVRINDTASKEELKDSLDQLAGLPIEYMLGGHEVSALNGVDLAVINPAINPNHPFLKEIELRNIEQTTEVNIFFQMCKGKIVGVIGTNGKETVVKLSQEILLKAGKDVIVGGNIGTSLLGQLKKINENTIVLFELSSFQLHRLDWIQKSPHVSAYLNIHHDHEQWHGSRQAYIDAKLVGLKYQSNNDIAIINVDDPQLRAEQSKAKAQTIQVSTGVLSQGIYVKDANIVANFNNQEEILSSTNLTMPGAHSISNALVATAIVYSLGIRARDIIEPVLTSFKGIENVLEFVSEINGVKYYNDTAASNPEATIAAIHSFTQPIWLILGGYDKRIDYSLVLEEAKKVKGVATIGQLATQFYEELKSHNAFNAGTLDQAVDWCSSQAGEGEIVLLSPATSSYDQFKNLEERGSIYKELVNKKANDVT